MKTTPETETPTEAASAQAVASSDLLACPFCGRPPTKAHCEVRCDPCNLVMHIGCHSTHPPLWRKWNTRRNEDADRLDWLEHGTSEKINSANDFVDWSSGRITRKTIDAARAG